MSKLYSLQDCFRLEHPTQLQLFFQSDYVKRCGSSGILHAAQKYQLYINSNGTSEVLSGCKLIKRMYKMAGTLFMPSVLARCSITPLI